MQHLFDLIVCLDGTDDFGVDPRWFQANVSKCFAAEHIGFGIPRQPCVVDHFSHQAKSVAVQTACGNPQHHVAFGNLFSVDQFFVFDNTDCKTSQVVVVFTIHVWHDRRFTAQQCHVAGQTSVADTLDDSLQSGRIVVAHRNVIQKEQRFTTGTQQIIDAHRDQIDSDRIVTSG